MYGEIVVELKAITRQNRNPQEEEKKNVVEHYRAAFATRRDQKAR